MTKVTYLLGAGASAGNPDIQNSGLPTNRNAPTLADTFMLVANELKQKMTAIFVSTNTTEIKPENYDTCTKLINDFQWLFNQSKLFGTVDTFAKFLHSIKSWHELIRLKKALSFYFAYQQITMRKFDDRTLVFLTTIMEKGPKFPNNVKILSWNYDSQIQIAALNFKFETISAKNKHTSLIQYYPSIAHGRDNEEYDMVQLNGIAGLKYLDNGKTVSPYYDLSTTPDDINLLIQWKQLKDNDDDLLTFAWEEDEKEHYETLGSIYHRDSLNLATKIAKDTEVLVVIGYSFPFFNRRHDAIIMQAMLSSGKLKKIYFQDPVLDGSFMREQFNFKATRDIPPIEHISNCRNYFVPSEL